MLLGVGVGHAAACERDDDAIHWEGFDADNALAAILTVLKSGASVWWNTRHVARNEHALVDLWARWHIEHGSLFVVLWDYDLEALRD
jgi:hypothetical protein